METPEYAVRLFAAMNTRPSRNGTRNDGYVCDAKPGECRYNYRYYGIGGLNNREAWELHVSDENCDIQCPYLINNQGKMRRDIVN